MNTQKIKKPLMALTVTIMIIMLASSYIPQTQAYTQTKQYVSISIEVERPTYDDFVAWYEANIAILDNPPQITVLLSPTQPDHLGYAWYQENATVKAYLDSIGDVIPQIRYKAQTLAPEVRLQYIKDVLDYWYNGIGTYPVGIFTFQPDSIICNYAYSKGVEYVTGYCFDQWSADDMSMRGGWQLPYYISEYNVLVPNNDTGGMVMYPAYTWDWYASFTVDHVLDTEPLGDPVDDLVVYIQELITENAQCSSPFSFTSFAFDYDWIQSDGNLTQVSELITWLTSQTYTINTLSQITTWFTANYQTSPTYKVDFTSPYDDTQIQWYFNTEQRLSKNATHILSIVNYTTQEEYAYMNATAGGEELIDISLTFELDALGGGLNRNPVVDTPIEYTGSLTTYVAVQEFNSSIPMIVMAVSVVVIFAVIKKIN